MNVKKIAKIANNPLVRIVAIILILYFGLFSNDYDNRSLKNRFSGENIKKSVDGFSKQKEMITKNLEHVKKLENSLQLETNEDIEDLTKEIKEKNDE